MRPWIFVGCIAILALTAVKTEPAVAVPPPEKADKSEVVTLDIKGLKFGVKRGKFTTGMLLTDQKSLDVAWPADKADYKEIQEKIKKQADFDKQQLMYFAWSGSGGDELTYKVEGDKKKTITFTYKPGHEDDLQAHFRIYAFPKGWQHQVEGGK